MKKTKLFIPILAGLIVGQIFAEGNRPFSIINTLRFGYDDNVSREADGTGSSFMEDVVDFAFNTSLSDRTDLVVKSQVRIKTDTESKIHPNLYAVLSHSVSPRLMFRFSDKFRSADKTSGTSNGKHDYYTNDLGASATYVLTQKDRLELSLNHQLRRHDEEIEEDDSTTLSAGISWARDIRPQRTSSKLNLNVRTTEYDKRTVAGTMIVGGVANTGFFESDTSGYDALDLTLEVNHTFNPKWQGTIEGGFTYVMPDKRDYTITAVGGVPLLVPIMVNADNKAYLSPIFKVGATYSPSPRTRVTGNYAHIFSESNDSDYIGQAADDFRFGIQHDVTAKIMAKATARFLYTTYEEDDSESSSNAQPDQERMDLEFRLTYKLNRLNFLEMGIKHSEQSYDDGNGDWDQNMFDVGWRVEL